MLLWFLPVQVPDVLHVGEVLQVLREPAAHGAGSLSSSSQDSETEQQETSKGWTSVYCLAQACIIQFSAQRGGMKRIALLLCAACFRTDYWKWLLPCWETSDQSTWRQKNPTKEECKEFHS